MSQVVDLSREKEEEEASSGHRNNAPGLVSTRAIKWTVPSSFNGETLYEAFNWDPTAVKPRWQCALCSRSDANITRLHEHVLESHSLVPGMLSLVAASVEAKTNAKTKPKLLAQIERLRTSMERGSKSGGLMFPSHGPKTPGEKVQIAVANAIIRGPLPYRVCEEPWVYDLIQAGVEIGAQAVLDACKQKPTVVLPNTHILGQSRTTMQGVVSKECTRIYTESRNDMLAVAQQFGCTQVSDGRSNISNDALLVFGVQSGAAFLALGAHNAGSAKKDADYLMERSQEYLRRDVELANETFAVVSDGAAACMKANKQISNKEHLVAIRCQSHAVSLFLKALAKGPFAQSVDVAVDLINWVRARPRLHSLVREHSKKSVFRVIEIRFATHVTALTRLLDLWTTLGWLILNEEYYEYKDCQTTRVREEFAKYEAIIRDASFWSGVKAFCKVAFPGACALRLMDRSAVRTKDVNPIWTSLGNSIGEVLAEKHLELAAEKKHAVFSLFLEHRRKAHCPVFDAAQVLNPANLTEVRRLATRSTAEVEIAEWRRLRDNTLVVLEQVVRRRAMVEARSARSQKRQKVDNVGVSDVEDMDDIPSEIVEARFKELWPKVREEFRDYYAGQGKYSGNKLDSEDGWVDTDGLLKFFAVRILNMTCTISDVERLHKVYSGIHTPARNRLLDARVDELSMARLALRVKEANRMNKARITLDDIKAFEALSMEKGAAALLEWSKVLSDALVRVGRAIDQPRDTIEVLESTESLGEGHDEAESLDLQPEEDDDGDSETPEETTEAPLGIPPRLAQYAQQEESETVPMPMFLML